MSQNLLLEPDDVGAAAGADVVGADVGAAAGADVVGADLRHKHWSEVEQLPVFVISELNFSDPLS